MSAATPARNLPNRAERAPAKPTSPIKPIRELEVACADMTNRAHATSFSRWAIWIVPMLMALLYWPTVAWLWDRWTMSVWQNAHGILIAGFVAWLIRDELKRVHHLPEDSSAWGFAFLVPALLLHALDTGMHTQLLAAAAMFMALPGLSLLFLGRQRTRVIAFPLALLFLTLPIPLVFTEGLHLILRKVATAGTASLVPLLGIPVHVEGTLLHTPRGDLLVADACSGFSTLYASIVVASLVAYHCPDPRRRTLVLLLAAPIAIVANILRVALLVVLVAWQGLEILGTSWHTISGLFTFVVALPIIMWLGRVPHPASKAQP